MLYKCEGPDCSYETNNRHQIEEHHIISRKEGGNNTKFNRIRLCPNCHSRIYIPGIKPPSKHAIKTDNYIILDKIVHTTKGLAIIYKDIDNVERLSILDTWRDSLFDKIIEG